MFSRALKIDPHNILKMNIPCSVLHKSKSGKKSKVYQRTYRLNKKWCIYTIKYYFCCHGYILLDMDLFFVFLIGERSECFLVLSVNTWKLSLYSRASVRASWLLKIEIESSNLSKSLVC